MIRYHPRRSALFNGFLLLLLAGGVGLWLRVQQRQYALNRMLIAALVKGDDRQALALVNAGADPNTRYLPPPAPALLQWVKQLLHRSPLPVNGSPTAFMIACGAAWNNDLETLYAQIDRPDTPQLVEAMLRHGAHVNDRGGHGWTPLIAAAQSRAGLETVRLLLEHGADVNAQDQHGWSPLMKAEEASHPKTALLLLEHGADVNARKEDGETPLIVAAISCRSNAGLDLDAVSLLLQYGAHVNDRDHSGCTALLDAVAYGGGAKVLIRLLLAHRADPNLATKYGDTPLSLATLLQRPDLVALLKLYGARK